MASIWKTEEPCRIVAWETEESADFSGYRLSSVTCECGRTHNKHGFGVILAECSFKDSVSAAAAAEDSASVAEDSVSAAAAAEDSAPVFECFLN